MRPQAKLIVAGSALAIVLLLPPGADAYAARLRTFVPYFEALHRIGVGTADAPGEPCFGNDFFDGLDGVALYCLLAETKPALYLEVGSGYSTKFARRSIADNGLDTRVVSVDPAPRQGIDRLCDEVIRSPLEAVDLALFDRLGPGDMLFVDNSHRCFMNSDVTACFLDIMPRLQAGVLVQLHDIFWPLDYPARWAKRYYNEQYVIGAMLANGMPNFDIVLPNYFISLEPELAAIIEPLWAGDQRYADVPRHGASLWLRRR